MSALSLFSLIEEATLSLCSSIANESRDACIGKHKPLIGMVHRLIPLRKQDVSFVLHP
jgi:hypothetical protein